MDNIAADRLSPAVAKPAHVPDAAVYDFDMFLDPALTQDPHKRVLELLRVAPPVFWTPRNMGHLISPRQCKNSRPPAEPQHFPHQYRLPRGGGGAAGPFPACFRQYPAR